MPSGPYNGTERGQIEMDGAPEPSDGRLQHAHIPRMQSGGVLPAGMPSTALSRDVKCPPEFLSALHVDQGRLSRQVCRPPRNAASAGLLNTCREVHSGRRPSGHELLH